MEGGCGWGCGLINFVCLSLSRVLWDRVCGSDSEEDEEMEEPLTNSGASEAKDVDTLDPRLKR